MKVISGSKHKSSKQKCKSDSLFTLRNTLCFKRNRKMKSSKQNKTKKEKRCGCWGVGVDVDGEADKYS